MSNNPKQTDSFLAEVNRLLSKERSAPPSLPKTLDRAARNAAVLCASCVLVEDKRNIMTSCLESAQAKLDKPLEMSTALLKEFADRVNHYIHSLPVTGKKSSIRVRLGNPVSGISELEEGQSIVIIANNGKKSLAMVEGVDRNRGFWIKKVLHTNQVLSEESTRLGEAEYIPYGEVHCPQGRTFHHVKT